jgi:invasion protein IalB
LALFAGGSAFAQQAQAPAAGAPPPQQQQQPQGPVKADLVPVQPEWTKVCGGDPQSQKEVCYTTRDFGLQADQPILALAVYDPKGAPEKVIRLLLPPGLLLKPGFRFAIDKGPQEAGAFEICFPNGCFAEAKVKPTTVDSMKKAEKLSVVVKNQVNNEVTFVLPLTGFGKAFDGPAIDPKVLEERQKKLQEDMEKKAKEEREKLEKQGGAAAPAPAPAPAGKAPAGK